MKDKNIPTIGIDIMGADTAAHNLLEFISYFTDVDDSLFSLKIYLTQAELSYFEAVCTRISPQFEVSAVIAEETISMDDDALSALRKKKSSLHRGIEDLNTGKLDAFISMGNTAALLAIGRRHFTLFEGMSRPALVTQLPTKEKPVTVLDIGANVTCSAENLLEFACLGIAYQKCLEKPYPKVGLLNIGSEEKKGRQELRQAFKVLQSAAPSSLYHFSGNIEGREVFEGSIDVLVTDGFTGNIFLKTCEGISGFVMKQMEENAPRPDLLKSFFSQMHKLIYFNEYPGAILAGFDKLLMKCHGSSSAKALYYAACEAIKLIKGNFIQKLRKEYNAVANVILVEKEAVLA